MKHANIALFVPHVGCPHRCSFCDQRRITGQEKLPRREDVIQAVETALCSGKCDPKETEIAFFGGSFTAMGPSYQEELLSAAFHFVQNGEVSGIRISTRPDAIDETTLQRLKQYGVSAIELGAQSMDDNVLEKNRRGHTAEQVVTASEAIRRSGFSLGLQMMTGLYGDTPDGARYTAKALADCSPDTMRIYPTLVLHGTELEALYRSGEYTPMELEEAVSLCSELLTFFEERQIRVIRLGLHDSGETAGCVAGPYHPAFAQLCRSRVFLQKVTSYLREKNVSEGELRICVHPKTLSDAIGQKRHNLKALEALGYICRMIPDDAMLERDFRIEMIQNTTEKR